MGRNRLCLPPQMREMRDGVRLCVDSRHIVYLGAPRPVTLVQVSRLQEILSIRHLGYKS